MKRWIVLLALLLPGLAHGGPNHGQQFNRNAQNMMIMHEMQRRASERDQEWRRRDDDQRRRAEDERQRDLWRRDEERRRENARQQGERARAWGQRQIYEEQRLERFNDELLRRDTQKQRGGSYREPEYRNKPLDAKELRRYELIKPGDRP